MAILKKILKRIVIGSIVIILILVISILLFVLSLPDMCGNKVVAEIASPNGKNKTVIFERSCGATTDFSTQVSILSVETKLKNVGGNTLIITTNRGKAPPDKHGGPEVRCYWLSDSSIELQYHKEAKIVRSTQELDGIRVSHVTFK